MTGHFKCAGRDGSENDAAGRVPGSGARFPETPALRGSRPILGRRTPQPVPRIRSLIFDQRPALSDTNQLAIHFYCDLFLWNGLLE